MSKVDQLEATRDRFEERVFNKHFISTLEKTGFGGCLSILPDPSKSLTKAELCERGKDGEYVRPEVSAMWFGWSLAHSVMNAGN